MRRTTPGMRFAAAGVAVLLLAGCTAAPRASAPPSATTGTPSPSPTRSTAAVEGWWAPTGEVTTLGSGLAAPWSVVPLAGGGALISQRDDGRVLELTGAGVLREAGTVPGVVSGGEAGLHGLAVLAVDGDTWLYAYHGASEDNRVVRMPLTGAAGSLALGEPQVVIEGIARAGNHNGGRIAVGPDGMLYVTTGDAGRGDASQNPDSLNGKILRLTPAGETPAGNPFGSPVWSLGHRNVQGIAWTSDGTMWASEFGQNTWDELNVIEPGANYGWPIIEGAAGDSAYTDPVAEWPTSDASPSGIAAIGDTVFMAGLRGARLWIIDTEDGGLAVEPRAVLTGEHGRLRDAVAGPDSSLWVLTNNTDGRGSPRPDDDLLLRLPVVSISAAG